MSRNLHFPPDPADDAPGARLELWTVGAVYPWPCRWAGAEERGDVADPPFVRGDADFVAQALTLWWQPDDTTREPTSPLATPRRLTGIRNLTAWSFEVKLPATVDLSGCDQSRAVIWRDPEGHQKSIQPGERDLVWTIDVPDARFQGLPANSTYVAVAVIVVEPGASDDRVPELRAALERMIVAP